jgi:hypothetical protein
LKSKKSPVRCKPQAYSPRKTASKEAVFSWLNTGLPALKQGRKAQNPYQKSELLRQVWRPKMPKTCLKTGEFDAAMPWMLGLFHQWNKFGKNPDIEAYCSKINTNPRSVTPVFARALTQTPTHATVHAAVQVSR